MGVQVSPAVAPADVYGLFRGTDHGTLKWQGDVHFLRLLREWQVRETLRGMMMSV